MPLHPPEIRQTRTLTGIRHEIGKMRQCAINDDVAIVQTHIGRDTVLEQSVNLEHGRLTRSVSPAPAGGPGSVMDYVWNRADSALPDAPSRPRGFAGKSFIPGP